MTGGEETHTFNGSREGSFGFWKRRSIQLSKLIDSTGWRSLEVYRYTYMYIHSNNYMAYKKDDIYRTILD